MSVINSFVDFFVGPLNTFAWLYFFLPAAVVGGLYLTIRNKGVQFSKFGYAMKNTIGKVFSKQEAASGTVTPFQAVTTALAATVGTGNIVGTSQAIALGGYGAVFWLWVVALFGMCTKYSEVVLSIKYRERNEQGDYVGGPMYYIKNGMGKNWKWLAAAFAVFGALASFGIGNGAQANSIVGAINNSIMIFIPELESVPAVRMIVNFLLGCIMAILVAVILFGGIKRIGSVTEKLIPVMSLLYIVFSLIVIFANIDRIGYAFGMIFRCAFSTKAIGGAAAGILTKNIIIWGMRRSAFSNEAGLGSAAIAHAAADCKTPVDQGLYGIFEVFMDTILICSMTALTIICSGVEISFGVKPGSELITGAFSTILGAKFASVFVAVALCLFAFSTILGWSLYGTRCVEYLFHSKGVTKVFQLVFIAIIIIASCMDLGTVWDITDTLNGLMAIPNFIAVFALSGVVAKETKDYFDAQKNTAGTKLK